MLARKAPEIICHMMTMMIKAMYETLVMKMKNTSEYAHEAVCERHYYFLKI